MSRPRCRFCASALDQLFADLGKSPLANSFLAPEQLSEMEPFYPLRAFVCGSCFLVQLEDHQAPAAIFSEYAYFSSYSTTWLEHARRYVSAMTERFALGPESYVVEVASNDGYLLRWFRERAVPVLGVEPARNVAAVAVEQGIPTVVDFFGTRLARKLAAERQADLLLGANVLAHVPDLNDFVAAIKIMLAPGGVATMEFPHLLRLIEARQFDTIYHEHFSYFGWLTVREVFAQHGLTLFDVEELPTHGGSLRIFARHEEDGSRPVTDRAERLAERERAAGLRTLETYVGFARLVPAAKRQVLEFLLALKREGRTIVGYGAPAKGNTLLNYCGVGRDFLEYTVDMSPHKQGLYLPGTQIPIRSPEALSETKPDVVLILPWNLRDEIAEQLAYAREWGARFAARSPELAFLA